MAYTGETLPEHTGDTDATHILGLDGIAKRGKVTGVILTRAGAAAAIVTIFDSSLPTGDAGYATEEVMLGPFEVQAATVANTPIHLDFSGMPEPFARGIAVQLGAGDLGVQVRRTS